MMKENFKTRNIYIYECFKNGRFNELMLSIEAEQCIRYNSWNVQFDNEKVNFNSPRYFVW